MWSSAIKPNLRSHVGDADTGYEINEINEINEISYVSKRLFRIFHTERRRVTNLKGTGFYRLRKNVGPGRKDVLQGLKAEVFSIIYGTTQVVPDTKRCFSAASFSPSIEGSNAEALEAVS